MNKLSNSKIYKDIVKNKLKCYFVSPHLDDAIFSAGGLINSLSKKNVPVTVINVFTKASEAPYTISVKKFLFSCGYSNADIFYKDRLFEDRQAIEMANASILNLGFVDALWRRKGSVGLKKMLSLILPEIDYVYPIYRLSIAKGHVSKQDRYLSDKICSDIGKIIDENSIIFYPIAIGGHVDHKIVRDACDKLAIRKIRWSDYPYSKKGNIDKEYIQTNMISAYYYKPTKFKESLVNAYKSQIKAIFGVDREKINRNEEYYL